MTIRLSPSSTALRRTALAAAVWLLCAAPVWAAEYTSLAGVGAGGFQKWIDDAKSQGYEIRNVGGCDVGDHVEYSGVAIKTNGKVQFEARFDMTADEYKDYISEMRDKGFRPSAQSSYHTKKGPRFAAAWIKDGVKMEWNAKLNQTQKEFEDALADKRDDGMSLFTASAYQAPDGGPRYTSIFVVPAKDQTYKNRHNMTADQLQHQLDSWDDSGFMLMRVHAYDTPDGLRFLAIARKSPGDSAIAWKARFGLTGDQYQKTFDRMADDGYIPINICEYREGGETRFAAVWHKKK